MNSSHYSVATRQVGRTTFLKTLCKRGQYTTESSEKAVPPVIEYDDCGNYTLLGLKEILSGYVENPYRARATGNDFNLERQADLAVSRLYYHLQHFPTCPRIVDNNKNVPHPIAEFIYSRMVYVRPSNELQAKLDKLDYRKRGALRAESLSLLEQSLLARPKPIRLDFRSVPKHDVGFNVYEADKDGYALVAKAFSGGLYQAIPRDRILREIPSLKDAERFINPAPTDRPFEDRFRPFISSLRIAVLGLEHSMLDGTDLCASAVPKIACRLERKRKIWDIQDEETKHLPLEIQAMRASVQLLRVSTDVIDETQIIPSTVRLIFPGGVKTAAQVHMNMQAYGPKDTKIDAVMDLRTFSSKGAVAALAMLGGLESGASLDETIKCVLNMPKTKVRIGAVEYEGYVGEIPVFRPGQRYTELCRAKSDVTTDFIASSILKERVRVPSDIEEEYKQLCSFRTSILDEMRTVPWAPDEDSD